MINLLREHSGKVARVVLCRPSFVDFIIGVRRRGQVGSCPTVEDEMREEYQIELTDGRVIHQDGSVDEPVTLGLRINTDEREVMAAAQGAEKEVKATVECMAANLNIHSYRKSRT